MNDKVIREWARSTGHPVGNRGRLPSAVILAYQEAHPDEVWEESEHKPRARCRCGRSWAGLAQAHCATCHNHFSTVSNFDKHRVQGLCYIDGADLKQQWGPYGVTWVGAEDRPEIGEQ